MDVAIVTVTQLPKPLKFKEQQISITNTEEMNEEQSHMLKKVVE